VELLPLELQWCGHAVVDLACASSFGVLLTKSFDILRHKMSSLSHLTEESFGKQLA
jgi:hypothetical protein